MNTLYIKEIQICGFLFLENFNFIFRYIQNKVYIFMYQYNQTENGTL